MLYLIKLIARLNIFSSAERNQNSTQICVSHHDTWGNQKQTNKQQNKPMIVSIMSIILWLLRFRSRDLFGSQIPVTTEGFGLGISCKRRKRSIKSATTVVK